MNKQNDMNDMNDMNKQNKQNAVAGRNDLTRNEARDILIRYYRYLREHNMDRLCWDVVNQAVIALGGEGDSTLDHNQYLAWYERDGVTFEEVLEDEIGWTERVPEVDDQLPDAMKMARAVMLITEKARREDG